MAGPGNHPRSGDPKARAGRGCRPPSPIRTAAHRLARIIRRHMAAPSAHCRRHRGGRFDRPRPDRPGRSGDSHLRPGLGPPERGVSADTPIAPPADLLPAAWLPGGGRHSGRGLARADRRGEPLRGAHAGGLWSCGSGGHRRRPTGRTRARGAPARNVVSAGDGTEPVLSGVTGELLPPGGRPRPGFAPPGALAGVGQAMVMGGHGAGAGLRLQTVGVAGGAAAARMGAQPSSQGQAGRGRRRARPRWSTPLCSF